MNSKSNLSKDSQLSEMVDSAIAGANEAKQIAVEVQGRLEEQRTRIEQATEETLKRYPLL